MERQMEPPRCTFPWHASREFVLNLGAGYRGFGGLLSGFWRRNESRTSIILGVQVKPRVKKLYNSCLGHAPISGVSICRSVQHVAYDCFVLLLKHLGIPDCFATLRFARNAAVQPVFQEKLETNRRSTMSSYRALRMPCTLTNRKAVGAREGRNTWKRRSQHCHLRLQWAPSQQGSQRERNRRIKRHRPWTP